MVSTLIAKLEPASAATKAWSVRSCTATRLRWVNGWRGLATSTISSLQISADSMPTPMIRHAASSMGDPWGEYLRQLQEGIGELLVLGLQRADAPLARRWQEWQRQGEAVGLARLAGRLAALPEMLTRKSHTLNWDWQAAGRTLLELASQKTKKGE